MCIFDVKKEEFQNIYIIFLIEINYNNTQYQLMNEYLKQAKTAYF